MTSQRTITLLIFLAVATLATAFMNVMPQEVAQDISVLTRDLDNLTQLIMYTTRTILYSLAVFIGIKGIPIHTFTYEAYADPHLSKASARSG